MRSMAFEDSVSIIVWVCCDGKEAINDRMSAGRMYLRVRNKCYILPGFKMELERNGRNDRISDEKSGIVKGITAFQHGQ